MMVLKWTFSKTLFGYFQPAVLRSNIKAVFCVRHAPPHKASAYKVQQLYEGRLGETTGYS